MTARRSPDGTVYRDVPSVPGHDQLINRGMPNQHPISSITGLSEVIDSLKGGDGNPMEYTVAEKAKLAGIEAGAQANVITAITVNGTAVDPVSGTVGITIPEPEIAGYSLVSSIVWSEYFDALPDGYCRAKTDLMILIRTPYDEDTAVFMPEGAKFRAFAGYPYMSSYAGSVWTRRLARILGSNGEINDTPALEVWLSHALDEADAGAVAKPPGLQISKRTSEGGEGIYLYARS